MLVEPSAPSRVLLGSSTICELCLQDSLVSRRHAALEIAGDRLRLTDLGSTNGTTVEGVLVLDALLIGGEVVRVGDTMLRIERMPAAPEPEIPPAMRFGRVIGGSVAMRRLYPLCERLAGSDVPLIIEGETGTGKEQLAEAIHENSRRRGGPFTVYDCTTTAVNLVESVLFGHERGAFTGAVAARKGVFELADGGTLFLDEIGDLELPLQAKLLRAIERGEVQRVGADRWLKVDVRVIAATRRNLDLHIQEGRFRDDLFYRLGVARIELPPLRSRDGDTQLLARHFWRMLDGSGSPPEDFIRRLEGYDWPGNVRELYNAVFRRLSLRELDSFDANDDSDFDDQAARKPSPPTPEEARELDEIVALELPFPRARDRVMAEFERRYIEHLLTRHRGNVSQAAAASGIALRYFQRIRARQSRRAPT